MSPHRCPLVPGDIAARPFRRVVTVALAATLVLSSCAPPASEWQAMWRGPADAASFEESQKRQITAARESVAALLAVTREHTVENTLRPLDEAWLQLQAAGDEASLLENVHPDKPIREAASRATQQVMKLANEITLNPAIYDALSAIDASSADEVTKHYLAKTLREFRLQGVDRDAGTREKLKVLRDEVLKLEQEYQRNINADNSTVLVKDRAELAGLPTDFLAGLKPDATGAIALATDTTVVQPVLTYATNESLRKRVYLTWRNKAYPANIPLLQQMLAKRQQIADLLGYANWAAYITADKMVGSAERADAFVNQMLALSKASASREAAQLLAAARAETPSLRAIEEWSSAYYSEQLRKSRYDFDSRQARVYLPYAQVKQGVFDITGRLFGLSYRKLEGQPVWHPGVEVYDLLDGEQAIGRFYLDMHPRTGKFNHAAQFGLRTGIEGRVLPEAVLVCNFPEPKPGDPALLSVDDVETYFHEFGHLLHTLLGGRQRWAGVSGIRTEYDFVEAPSQLLEEWVRDQKLLRGFARHHETGEPIPEEMVARMKRAGRFGRGLWANRQAIYAAISLRLHQQTRHPVDSGAVVDGILRESSPFPVPEDMHFEASFGHLTGYSAIYYTYLWSLTISKDLLSAFDATNLMDPKLARRYRDTILAPGGSKPAGQLIRDFLGRDFSTRPFEEWLREGQTE